MESSASWVRGCVPLAGLPVVGVCGSACAVSCVCGWCGCVLAGWVRVFVSPPPFRRPSVRPSVVVPARLPVVLPLVLPVRLGLGGAAPPSFLLLLLVFGWGGSLVGPGSLGVLARLGLGWAPARSETSFQVSPGFVNVQGACFHIREGQCNASFVT